MTNKKSDQFIDRVSEKRYLEEINRRNELNNNINIPIVVLIALSGAFGYYITTVRL